MNGIDLKLFLSLILFLQHDENCIDVREYVIALSVVCRPAKTLETMKLAFKVHSFPFCQVHFNQFLCVGEERHLPQLISEGINTYVFSFLACSVLFLFHARISAKVVVTLMFRRLFMPECLRLTCIIALADVSVSIMTFFPPYLSQMFEAEEDGAITELELAVILKTALGVTYLCVSRLFNAIDVADTGKITFGEWVNRICC